MEWNGLGKYLRVYYAAEINPKPEPDVLTYIFTKHNLLRKDVIVIGISGTDEEFAQSCGVDYLNISGFL